MSFSLFYSATSITHIPSSLIFIFKNFITILRFFNIFVASIASWFRWRRNIHSILSHRRDGLIDCTEKRKRQEEVIVLWLLAWVDFWLMRCTLRFNWRLHPFLIATATSQKSRAKSIPRTRQQTGGPVRQTDSNRLFSKKWGAGRWWIHWKILFGQCARRDCEKCWRHVRIWRWWWTDEWMDGFMKGAIRSFIRQFASQSVGQQSVMQLDRLTGRLLMSSTS